jgi:hypothetical protein
LVAFPSARQTRYQDEPRHRFDASRNDGKLALLVGWKDRNAANAWSAKKFDGIETLRHRKIRVVCDYGRFDRREAPQFYPDVKGGKTKHPEPAH